MTLSDYTIRLAEREDLIHIPVIEAEAARQFEPYAARLEISVDLLSGLTPMTFLKRAQAEKRIWVGAINAQPVGFIVAKFLQESCFIVELDVLSDYGRRGLGTALVECCCEGARLRNHTQVTLTTFRYVPWNIPFYQQCGFEILPPKRCPYELRAIVEHEARYGFEPKHRVVMRKFVSTGCSDKRLKASRK